MLYKPRDYQHKAFEDCVRHFTHSNRKGICVIATGGGKSLVIAMLAEHFAETGKKVLIITDRQELLVQNEEKIQLPTGVVSAGLNRREYGENIVLGGIQTIYNKFKELGDVDYILIDECQAVSNDDKCNSRYWQLLNNYPDAKVMGFTATPFRLNEDTLLWGDICHITTYKYLLEKGYLCPLTNKVKRSVESKNLKQKNGEYDLNDYTSKYWTDASFSPFIDDLMELTKDRKKVLIFCPTITFAKKLKYIFAVKRIRVEFVEGATKKTERENILNEYRDINSELRIVLNVNVLSVGFDNPHIDCIVCARPTMSLGLWQQLQGRGVRISEYKENCLLLDYSGNLMRYGSLLNDDWQFLEGKIIRTIKVKAKVCPSCQEMYAIHLNKCPCCGYVPLKEERVITINTDYDDKTDIEDAKSSMNWYYVSDIQYDPQYKSKAGRVMMKVSYKMGNRWISQYIWRRSEVRSMLMARGWSGYGDVNYDNLKKPVKILLDNSTKFPEIRSYKW